MKNIILFLLTIFISSSVFAARTGDHLFVIGKGSSTNDREVVFNVGDGNANPKIYVNTTDKIFQLNKNLIVEGDEAEVGDGTASDKTITFRTGVANEPKIRWNNGAGNIEFSDDGTTFNAFASGILPIGMVAPFALSTCPTGWLPADGTAVSRATYAGLFGLMGVTHGQGDGATTFNVPDYRGRFLRGTDGGAGRDPDAGSRTAMNTGGNTGDAVGSVQSDQYISHAHGAGSYSANSAGSHTHGIGAFNAAVAGGIVSSRWGGNARTATPATDSAGAHTHSISGSSSSAGGNETRPENANVTFCIKI